MDFTLITGITSICSALLSIATALSLIFKPVKKHITCARSAKNTDLALLRSNIVAIYYNYCQNEIIPFFEMENLIMLYKAYKDEGGNSFIDRLYKNMKKWEIDPSNLLSDN